MMKLRKITAWIRGLLTPTPDRREVYSAEYEKAVAFFEPQIKKLQDRIDRETDRERRLDLRKQKIVLLNDYADTIHTIRRRYK